MAPATSKAIRKGIKNVNYMRFQYVLSHTNSYLADILLELDVTL
jgi:hypothetical protein